MLNTTNEVNFVSKVSFRLIFHFFGAHKCASIASTTTIDDNSNKQTKLEERNEIKKIELNKSNEFGQLLFT